MSVVSVIMPARNAASTIAESLRSVLDQDCLAEIIVIDDGSTDGTADVAGAVNDARIKVIKGPATGISAALNAGFQAASGDFVARCDADDIFLPGRLAAQVQWLLTHPEYGAISGGYMSIDAKGNRLADLASTGNARDVSAQVRTGDVVTSFCTWLTRRPLLGTAKGARAWFQTAEDLDLQVRLAVLGAVWHDPAPVYGYRLHATSITHSRRAAQLAFFDDAVRTFAQDRCATGSDALERGEPPALPDFAAVAQQDGGLSDQMRGHLTAQAWKDFHAGRKRAALRAMIRALRVSPTSRAQWRGLLAMIRKSILNRP